MASDEKKPKSDPAAERAHAKSALVLQGLCLVMAVLAVLVFIRTRDARGTYRNENGTTIVLASDGEAEMTYKAAGDSVTVKGRWERDGGEVTVRWEGGVGRITYDWSPHALTYDDKASKTQERYERLSH